MAKIDKVLDEMIAWNLCTHVMDGYEFLMQNCQFVSWSASVSQYVNVLFRI